MDVRNKKALMRTAGWIYLSYFVVQTIATSLRANHVVAGVLEIVAAVLFLASAVFLYRLLRENSPTAAKLFLGLNTTGVVLHLVGTASLLFGENPEKDFIKWFMLAQVFFAAWLFPLAWAIYRSHILPKWLGVVILIHAISWSVRTLLYFVAPGFTAINFISYPLGFVAEFGLVVSLLYFGYRRK